MAFLCCIPDDVKHEGKHSTISKSSGGKSSGLTRGSSVYQIEPLDATQILDNKYRNAQQLRMQLAVTEELSSETYGLEIARKGKEKYEAQDFFLFKEILGSGSTAVVFRAMFKPTGVMYAIKFVPNFRTVKTMVVRELQVLKIANDSRFLIDFHSQFRVGPNLYFVTEICEGGSLNYLLDPKYNMPAKLMKIYLKELASAVFFLHGRKLVHRDISMENCLLSSTGHLKLGDFGLCRMVDDPSGEMMTDCGRANIKAPEIYMDKPSGFPLDWWSVGVLVYRFITGFFPFKTDKLTQGYQAVTKHNEKYPVWAFVDPHAKSLCQGLLTKKPRDRLASENEEHEIKSHPYFQDVKWDVSDDIIAIAQKVLDPFGDPLGQGFAERLLSAIGHTVEKVYVHLHDVYPPRAPEVPTEPPFIRIEAPANNAPIPFEFVQTTSSKGDGINGMKKETTKGYLETTV